MAYLLFFILGIFLGMIAIAITSMGSINESQEQAYNAEYRALTHFRKLFKIENIIRQAEKDKTPAVIVLDKLKEVITDDQSTNNF